MGSGVAIDGEIVIGGARGDARCLLGVHSMSDTRKRSADVDEEAAAATRGKKGKRQNCNNSGAGYVWSAEGAVPTTDSPTAAPV